MIIEIDFSSDIPIYIQLRNEIVRLIVLGEINASDSLPSVRRLANDLNINHMTVAKTYRLLKEEGFIEIDRRIGAKVTDKGGIREILLQDVGSDLDVLIVKAKNLGMDKKNFYEMIDERW